MRIRNLRHEESTLSLMGIIVGLLGISFLSYSSFSSIGQFQDHSEWVEHTHEVQFELEQAFSLIQGAQVATRGFAITGKQEFLLSYKEGREALPVKIRHLATLVADNPVQARNVVSLNEDMQRVLADMAHVIALRQTGDAGEPALAWVRDGHGDADLGRLRTLVSTMQAIEEKLLQERQRNVAQSGGRTKMLILYGTLASYLVFGGAFWLLLYEIRRRQRSDISLLKANEDLLLHAEQLETSNKELESFSYSISHDLRIPLRAIAGYASMLAEDYGEKLDDEGRRLLGVISGNSKRMGELIDDLLTFSRLGRKALSSNDIEMQKLVESVVADLQLREGMQHAKVTVNALPHSHGDLALLQQVWINLIANAFKYSSRNAAAEIRISGARIGDRTVYTVRDNGVGFDMRYYEKLFGVFQRLHSADDFPGTGVGLAIVQRIVQRHGGQVWAEGVLDEGAAFYFALPNKG